MPVSYRSNIQQLVDKQMGPAPRKRGGVVLPPDSGNHAIGRCGKAEDKHYVKWTPEDVAILRLMVPGDVDWPVIARALNRSISAVQVKASELGIRTGRARRTA
jgi:DNA-binding NarL/FixJ family response regulator